MLLKPLRELLVYLNQELPRNNLVTWTNGNVSIRDPETGYVAIKPSGVKFEDLTPENMVVVDLDGNVIEGDKKPSSDTASHLYIYRHRPDINGVIHTHSNYATAFAALGQPIPVYLTAQCDEVGGPIPCGRFATVGGEEIGQAALDAIGDSPVVLLKNHGVFAIGPNGEEALKAAIMIEDIARTVWLAKTIGEPDEIPPEMVARLHHRYTHEYGQEPDYRVQRNQTSNKEV
ncbi:MAG: L-ribulose-5-phosphate 4-epimerase [Anaerolineales bacterium]|nr:L-ribulose-5-phosphate 4-epimerase [Anaerolineales bacterium]